MPRGLLTVLIMSLALSLLTHRTHAANKTALGPQEFVKVNTPHFMICFQSEHTTADEIRRLGIALEKLYAGSSRLLSDFDKRLQSVAEQMGVNESMRGRIPIYLTDHDGAYESVIDHLASKLPDTSVAKQVKKRYRNVSGFDHGWAVVYNRQKKKGVQTNTDGPIIHLVARTMVRLYVGKRDQPLPIWLTAGWGYTLEFTIFGESKVRYIDYKKYYDMTENIQGAVFEDRNWARTVKQLTRDSDRRMSLWTVLSVESVEGLTPDSIGYMYAHISYCVSPAKRKTFSEFLQRLPEIDNKELRNEYMKAFGIEKIETEDARWHRWIMSSAFR